MSSKVVFIILLLRSSALYAQATPDSILNKLDEDKLSASIEKQLSKIEIKIVFNNRTILKRLQKQEVKIFGRQLATKDSLETRLKLVEIEEKYRALQERLRSPSSLITPIAWQYIPLLDTLHSVLAFISQNNSTINFSDALSKIESFNNSLQQAHEIKHFIRERQMTLQQELERLGLTKQLKQFNKEAYYFSQQIKEYQEIVSDPRKIERRLIGLVSKTKVFQEFMRKNSMLTSLFRIPGDPNDPGPTSSLAGLQTRVEVNNLIREQLMSGNANAKLQFQQNIQEAQSEVNRLKERLFKVFPSGQGSANDADVIPERFRPNGQKTRSFLSRLEYGVNFQAQKATNFFPATTDLGLSIGYKLNDRSIIGVGASYEAGLGRGWNHMELSSQGAGLRSYVDWKLKGAVWISAGFEMNYKSKVNGIRLSFPFGRQHEATAWQQSGLIGLSKVIDVKSQFFKKTKLQLLWDFLSYQQLPQTHPLVFRIGYNLK